MDRHTVVVIEDEPLIRVQAFEMFESAGMQVVGFDNGDLALDYLRENRDGVSAVFTDVKIDGGTDGLELAQLIAETCPEIAVVATSGQVPEAPSTLHPRVRYLRKPWQPFDVLNAIIDAQQQT